MQTAEDKFNIILTLNEKILRYVDMHESYILTNTQTIDKIYSLFINNESFNPEDSIGFFMSSIYYYNKKEYDIFLRYIFMSIDWGFNKGLVLLAKYFFESENIETAIKYCKLSIIKGENIAISHLGNYYVKKGLIKDAIEIFKIGVDKNYIAAIIELGLVYYNQKDYQKAMETWSLGANQNNPNCIENIGWCYIEKKNSETAMKYFEKAIKQGYTRSIDNVIHYHTVKKDYNKAIYYINIKGEKGNLIKKIKEYLTLKDGKDISADTIKIISKLTEEDIKNEELYLKILVRTLRTKMDELYTHFKYEVGGEGYKECENHWVESVLNNNMTDNILKEVDNSILLMCAIYMRYDEIRKEDLN